MSRSRPRRLGTAGRAQQSAAGGPDRRTPRGAPPQRGAAARRGARGFTLLEALIAAVILGVGLLALGIVELSASGSNRSSREISLATAFAEEMLERIRRNTIDAPAAYDGFDTSNPATRPGAAGMLRDDYDDWKNRIERAAPNGLTGGRGQVEVGAGPVPGTTQATVTVTWSGVPPSTSVQVQTTFWRQ